MRHLILAFRNLIAKRKMERELDEELRFHLEMQIEQNLQKGMGVEEARRQALISLGGLQQAKENCRDVRSGAFLDILIQDLRYAIRSLLKSPGLLLIVLTTLTLGIGASTAIFTVTHAVLLRPLPYPDPDQLMMVWLREKDGSVSNTNYATYKDWKEHLHSFEAIAAMSSWEPTLYGYGEPTPLEGLSVAHEFFSALGIGPFLGRDFVAQEDKPERNRVVILTYGFWQRRLGGDPAIIGKQINLSGIPRTVVGILPRRFESIVRYDYKEAEIFRPLGYDETLPHACRSCNHLTAIGRIRQGVDVSQAAREIDSFTAALVQKYPQDYGQAGATIVPLQEQLVSQVRKVLILLLAAVGIVLLVACANIANLLIARATRRSREMAVRAALGASRARLLRQLLTESILLAFTGGALGIALSAWATDVLARYAPTTIPRLHSISLNWYVLLFATAMTVLCGLLFGLAPALQGSRLRLQASLQESGRSLVGDRQNLRKGLVIANIALALILLSGTALLLQSIRQLLSQKLGFDKENVITMSIYLTGPQYDERETVDSYYAQVLNRIQALPGIESAGIVSQLPLSTNLDMYGVEARDKPLASRGQAPSAERFAITPGYLKALRIPILRGRGITAEDHAGSVPVVVVNRTFAEKMWPGEDPIGKQIHIGEPERPWRAVVGVTEDVRHRGLQEPFAMQFYMPFQQWFDTSMTVVVRTTIEPRSATESIRKAIWSVDSNQPISQIATMKQVVEATIAQKKFALRLVEFFAISALFLAAIGVYGVMAYSVTARVQEIGVRMALGADRSTVLSLILRSGLVLTVCGIFFGVIGALFCTRFLSSMLFRVEPTDPFLLTVVTLILFGVAFIASAVPAIRASRFSPVLALRHE
jgi:putative ABC transport system permease protein